MSPWTAPAFLPDRPLVRTHRPWPPPRWLCLWCGLFCRQEETYHVASLKLSPRDTRAKPPSAALRAPGAFRGVPGPKPRTGLGGQKCGLALRATHWKAAHQDSAIQFPSPSRDGNANPSHGRLRGLHWGLQSLLMKGARDPQSALASLRVSPSPGPDTKRIPRLRPQTAGASPDRPFLPADIIPPSKGSNLS